jgi:hypothetical protein
LQSLADSALVCLPFCQRVPAHHQIKEPATVSDLEAAAVTLEARTASRVLRRLTPREEFSEDDDAARKVVIILDVETTGVNAASDEIIELWHAEVQLRCRWTYL